MQEGVAAHQALQVVLGLGDRSILVVVGRVRSYLSLFAGFFCFSLFGRCIKRTKAVCFPSILFRQHQSATTFMSAVRIWGRIVTQRNGRPEDQGKSEEGPSAARTSYLLLGVVGKLVVEAGRKGRLGRDEATEGLRDKWEGHTHNERNAIGV